MSVSSVHSAPHCRRGLFIEVPLQHQSCVIIRWWPFCWLPGDPGLCTLDLQFSTKEWYVCIVVGQFLCIRGCNENWPLEIGFWEVYLPVNSVSHTFARIFLDGRYAGINCCLVAKSCLTLLRPHGLYATKLLCPWDFPGKNTAVGCRLLL